MTAEPAAPIVSDTDIARITTALTYSADSVAQAAAIVNDGLTYATDRPGTWLVRSVTDKTRWYVTTLTSCTCPSHVHRGHCKHQTAVLVRILAASAA